MAHLHCHLGFTASAEGAVRIGNAVVGVAEAGTGKVVVEDTVAIVVAAIRHIRRIRTGLQVEATGEAMIL